MPAVRLPLTSSQMPIEPQTKGAPNGSIATSAVTAPNRTGASSPAHQ
jgi:hypothetical protein